jgi:hypothetical protein
MDYTDLDGLAGRLFAIHASLLALIRSVPLSDTVHRALAEEAERVRTVALPYPVSELFLQAFENQLGLTQQALEQFHSSPDPSGQALRPTKS